MARPDLQLHPDAPQHDEPSGRTTGSGGPVIQVATRCTTIDEFVDKFAGFASEGALVLPATGDLPLGTEGRFAVLLRDRSVAMRGRCRVTESRPAPPSPNGSARRTMLRVELTEMDEQSTAVHRRLLYAQRSPVPLPAGPGISERTDVSPLRVAAAAPPIGVRPVTAPPVTARAPVAPRIAAKLAASPIATPTKAPRPVVPPPLTVRPMPTPRAQIATIRAPTLMGIAAQPRDETPMWSPRHVRSRIGESSGPVRVRAQDPLEVTRIQEPPITDALRDSARVALPGMGTAAPEPIRAEATVPVHPPAETRASPVSHARSVTRAPPVSHAPRVTHAPPVAPVAPVASKSAPPPPVVAPAPKSVPPPVATAAPKAAVTAPVTAPPKWASPIVETRAPGAAFKLPANPLSDLGPNDLASFVDCTLYETDGGDDISITEDDGEPTREAKPPPPAPLIPPPLVLGATAAARATAVLPATRHPSLALRIAEPARKLSARAGIYLVCVIAGLAGGRLLLGKSAPTAATVAAPRPAPAVTVAVPPPSPAVAAPPAPASAPPVAKPPSPITAVSVAMAAPAPSRPQPAKPSLAVEPVLQPLAEPLAPPPLAKSAIAATPTPPPGECVARVVTEPDGVQALWGDKVLGVTPIVSAPIPCGVGKLTLRRDRYQPFSRDMTAAPGTVTSVAQRLHRPTATLAIGSSPANATITINGQSQGATPRKLTVSRYQVVAIKVSLPGYETWTKTVYLREPETRIAMQLARAAAKP